MPPIVTFKNNKYLKTQWNVSSDDCVIPSIISIAVGLSNMTLLSAGLCTLYLRPVCLTTPIPPLLYAPLLALLALKTAVQLNEGLILIVSSLGTIKSNTAPRKRLNTLIYIRILLALLELVALISAVVGVSHPTVAAIETQCADFALGLHLTKGIVGWLCFIYILFVIKSVTLVDPLGCFSPGLIEYLPLFDKSDNRGSVLASPMVDGTFVLLNSRAERKKSFEDSLDEVHTSNRIHVWTKRRHGKANLTPAMIEKLQSQHSQVHNNNIGTQKMERRLKAICCCLGVTGQRSRGAALEDVAKGLFTVFDDPDIGLTDVVAGFVLTKQSQRRKIKRGDSLTSNFRKTTFRMMPPNQRFSSNPEMLIPDKPLDFGELEDQLLLEDLVHYMHYAMGVYGWPLYVFSNKVCGLFELGAATCCQCNYRCFVGRSKTDFPDEGCCLCAVGALKLAANIDMDDILYFSLENKIYTAPFSVCLDHKMKSVVVSVRGTLSLKDTLTDMSFSPIHVTVHPVNETYVHGGMLRAAVQIHETITKEKLMEKAFTGREDYQLVVVGHSLGAGVASVLALLFKLEKKYPRMKCFAYSPPGCLFSFPLAKYCKEMITSVVLGNDMVPRLTLRSLLLLKTTVSTELERCDKPKYRVFCETNSCRKLHSMFTKPHPRQSQHKLTRNVSTDGSCGVDEVDGDDGEVGECGECGECRGECEEWREIEKQVLNNTTTTEWLRDQLFKRQASVQPEDTNKSGKSLARFFSRSRSVQLSQVDITRKMQRSVSIQPPRLTTTPAFSLRRTAQGGIDEVDTGGIDEVDSGGGDVVDTGYHREISPEHFQGTEDLASHDLATPGSVIYDAVHHIDLHCRPHDGNTFLPLFPGGKVVHIEMEDQGNNNCWSCFSKPEYTLTEVPNDKLCVIQIDEGVIDHHLPNRVLDALKLCYTNLLLTNENYDPEVTQKKRLDNAKFCEKLFRATNKRPSRTKGFDFGSPSKPVHPFPGNGEPSHPPSGLLLSTRAPPRRNKPQHHLVTLSPSHELSEDVERSGDSVYTNSHTYQLSDIKEEPVELNKVEVKVEVHKSREELSLPLGKVPYNQNNGMVHVTLPDIEAHESTV